MITIEERMVSSLAMGTSELAIHWSTQLRHTLVTQPDIHVSDKPGSCAPVGLTSVSSRLVAHRPFPPIAGENNDSRLVWIVIEVRVVGLPDDCHRGSQIVVG